MKLIIQIPCYNEALTLPATLQALPRSVPGFTSVEWLIINDGSADGTVEAARAGGVDHILDLPENHGLAHAFSEGIQACLQLGADVIVNTDADNQYCADDIPRLVEPLLANQADIVIGTRPIDEIVTFSPAKRFLQKLGSLSVRIISRTQVADAPSGFRAFSRHAALRINIFTRYSHTLETILQANQKKLRIICVPIRVNPFTRPSRLMKGIGHYILHSASTMLRIFVVYNPFQFFSSIGTLFLAGGFLVCLRYLNFFLRGGGHGHVQSLILAAILLFAGIQTWMVAFLADLLSINRRLLEDLQSRAREEALGTPPRPGGAA